ncbi:copper resistance CopC family protein [Dictyobacter aurantiacus]|nr:copper resistance CopC family protein [Dictyobacter aurantiacus]
MLIYTGSALAQPVHGEYVSSVPAANAMLTKAPTTVTVRFSEPVDPNLSDIQVYDVTGRLVNTAPAKLNGNDRQTMVVPMQANNSEIYLVTWHNTSTDEGHRDSGSFRFFVNISPMLKGMVKSELAGHPMMANTNKTTPSRSTTTTPLPGWLKVLLAGIIGLLAGSAVTFMMARHQQQHKASLPQAENTLEKK